MATYISTFTFTGQGVKAVKETTKRAAAVRAAAKKLDVKVTNFFWTLGAYDGLVIFEASDEETATALMLQVGSQGNVRTTTVRAFNSAEMDKVLAKMGG